MRNALEGYCTAAISFEHALEKTLYIYAFPQIFIYKMHHICIFMRVYAYFCFYIGYSRLYNN